MKKSDAGNLILKLLFAAGLVGWFLYKNDLSRIFAAITSVPVIIFLIAATLMFFSLMVNSVKWFLLLPQYNIVKLFEINLIGQYYGLILPGQILGEGAKAYILGRGRDDVEKIWVSVFFDKITGLIALFVLGISGIVFTHRQLPVWFISAVIISICTCFLVLFLIRINALHSLLLKLLNNINFRFKKLHRIISRIVRLIDAWYTTTQKTKVVFLSISVGIMSQVMGICINMLLSHAIGIHVSFIDWCWVQAVVSVLMLIPVTVGGIGIREGSLIGLLGWLDVSSEKALALSFTIFGLQIIRAVAGAIAGYRLSLIKSRI